MSDKPTTSPSENKPTGQLQPQSAPAKPIRPTTVEYVRGDYRGEKKAEIEIKG